MSVIEIKPSRASDLLKDMAEHGIIEPVTGHGKGKYRFKSSRIEQVGIHHQCGGEVSKAITSSSISVDGR
jgi:hypothetical protein